MAKRGFACRVQVTGRTTRICPKRRVSHASAGGEAGDFKKLFTIEERSGRGRGGKWRGSCAQGVRGSSIHAAARLNGFKEFFSFQYPFEMG